MLNGNRKKKENKENTSGITLRRSRYGWVVYYKEVLLKFFRRRELALLYISDSALEDVYHQRIREVNKEVFV